MEFEIGGRSAVLVNGKLEADYLAAREVLQLGENLQPTDDVPAFARVILEDGSALLLRYEEREKK